MAGARYLEANAKYLPVGFRWPELFERVDLRLYYPPFRERIVEAKGRAAERGARYWSEFGWRGWAQQATLRVLFLAGKGGRAAPPGDSGHLYGVADDSTADADPRPGLQPTWEHARYLVLGEELERVGLVWGASFGDMPHANWPGCSSAHELAPLKQLWLSCPTDMPDETRLRLVWDELDRRPSPPRKAAP